MRNSWTSIKHQFSITIVFWVPVLSRWSSSRNCNNQGWKKSRNASTSGYSMLCTRKVIQWITNVTSIALWKHSLLCFMWRYFSWPDMSNCQWDIENLARVAWSCYFDLVTRISLHSLLLKTIRLMILGWYEVFKVTRRYPSEHWKLKLELISTKIRLKDDPYAKKMALRDILSHTCITI